MRLWVEVRTIEEHVSMLCTSALAPLIMSQQPITVVGDGNIAGNNLHNVGNQIRVQHFYGPKVADGKL